MSREPNFTAGASENTLTIGASPRPPLPAPPPSPQVIDTIACLKAEVRYLERKGRTDRLDTADEYRARGERLPSGSTVARILRRTAGMVWDCPPPWEPGPVPTSLPSLLSATMDGDW